MSLSGAFELLSEEGEQVLWVLIYTYNVRYKFGKGRGGEKILIKQIINNYNFYNGSVKQEKTGLFSM